MAKKSGTKGSLGYDYHPLTPEQKQKVNSLCDQFPEVQKDTVAILLNHHDFDQDKAVHALTIDGGSSALAMWKSSLENNQTKTNRNKKKNKKKSRKEGFHSVSGGNDGDDSSSLHSSSNIDFDPEKDTHSKIENCDDVCEKFEKEGFETFVNDCNKTRAVTITENKSNDKVLSAIDYSEKPRMEECHFPVDQSSELKAEKEAEKKSSNNEPNESVALGIKNSDETSEKNEDNTRVLSHKHHRQRHSSSHHSKSSSISEDVQSTQSPISKNRGGLVKCTKDLTRQTVSLQRIELQLDNRLEDASKCLKNMFTEVKKMLDKRQADLEEKLTKVKTEALSLLKSRQDLASELKRKVDRANSMNESEWNELRADIKQFVTERKYDDELGKTIWFHWSMDAITESIRGLGEVCSVKNSYSQRQIANMSSKSPENSNERQAANQNNWIEENSAENNQWSAAHSCSNEVLEEAKSVKDTMGRGQNVRVFCSTRYNHGGRFGNHNRGRGGFFKAAHSGSYFRGRHYDNWQYSGSERHNDYRKPYHQDRTDYRQQSSIVDKSVGTYDSGDSIRLPFAKENHYNRGGSYDRKSFSNYNRSQRGQQQHNQYAQHNKIPRGGRMRFNPDVANPDISKVENLDNQQQNREMYNGV